MQQRTGVDDLQADDDLLGSTLHRTRARPARVGLHQPEHVLELDLLRRAHRECSLALVHTSLTACSGLQSCWPLLSL